MARTFISPSKYIQGPGELKNLGTYAAVLGKKILVLISPNGLKRFGADIEASFAGKDMTYIFESFNGECSKKEINRIIDVCKANDIDCMVGVGGGKIFDTIKAVAYYLDKPVIICPTIAATDAPCSALSVIYTEEGAVEEYLFLKQNPNVVLMDSAVIAKSPVRLTVSGMGDALATYIEARASYKHDGPNFAGGKALHTGIALAKLCFDTLMSDGVKAKTALEVGALTPAVEAVIEANTLLSGLGFESGGIAASHAIHNGFCSLEECHHYYHGEKVAFGVISQLVLENAPEEELNQVLDFCIAVGLPVTMAEIGVTEPTWEKLMQVATIACGEADTARNMPFDVDPEMVANAILGADAIGRKALAKKA
ncbi:MAG: glycerol dehydrogenase [Lachnospiraceae bacterium]|nr:glycerol dehydrogenase [Lachnospiraceae bacterium]